MQNPLSFLFKKRGELQATQSGFNNIPSTSNSSQSQGDLTIPSNFANTPGTIICENQLPKALDLRRIAEIAKQIPPAHSHDADKNFSTSHIRQNGIIKFKHDKGDEARREIVKQLSNPDVVSFFSSLFGERRYAAGCQFHTMHKDSLLGAHTHGRDDVFVIFHFEQNYSGGGYYEIINGERYYPRIPPFSAYVSHFGVRHGVDTVLSGTREVLVTSWDPSSWKL